MDLLNSIVLSTGESVILNFSCLLLLTEIQFSKVKIYTNTVEAHVMIWYSVVHSVP